jgi:hypothetical protein
VNSIITAVRLDVRLRAAFIANARCIEGIWFIHRLLRATLRTIELLIDISAAFHELGRSFDAFIERMKLHANSTPFTPTSMLGGIGNSPRFHRHKCKTTE